VSLSTCGAMTGFTFAHGTVTDMTSPTSVPVHLLARDEPATPAVPPSPASSQDGALRSAIVSVARHYLQLAQTRTPAEMEALIWQADSTDGADHGQSCAAFASLTLALGARAAGQQSWVTGGGSYPWPLHPWADVRVEPNPASPDVTSMLQDAQAHHRWHPLGDGYRPQPGDWVLFDGHVEVLTRYTGAALYTVGGDSLPDLTVNAHKFPAPFGAQGVLGFVNNGELASTADRSAWGDAAEVPGLAAQLAGAVAQQGQGSAAIPGVLVDTPGGSAGQQAPAYRRHDQPPAGAPGTVTQQAFISLVAPGAIAAEQRYGVPAAVTIALYRYDAATPAAASAAWASQAGTSQAGASQAGASQAVVPGVPATGAPAGGGRIPGVASALAAGAVRARTTRSRRPGSGLKREQRPGPRIAPRGSLTSARRYVPRIPYPVAADFAATARGPLTRARPLYQDVAGRTGIGWELLAACDWMQCQARPRYSPVHGEKIGTVNPDGTVFRTKSTALAQCASDLIELADAVYLIDLTGRRALSVLELANVFAAFRWGGLLVAHGISAMEFPYSVAGLTVQQLKMRWPDIGEPYAPDKPGARFRLPFGAVPAVLSLGYRALA
jgi:hypothetical protein